MSKIAELLKLAEQRKEKVEPTSNATIPAAIDEPPTENGLSVSKSKSVRVSKGNEIEVKVSKGNEVKASRSKGNEVKVSKSNERESAEKFQQVRSSEVSPSRDFTKVSNSITKHAIPEKYFRGLSKHTYDVLYQRTRGAINPVRTIQLTKDQLVSFTGLSKDAVKLHIKYLKDAGLLDSRPVIGSHAGWEYEVFIPEEINYSEQVSVRQSNIGQSKASENLHLHTGENLHLLTPSKNTENKEYNDSPKTSYKTNTNDDEGALAGFVAKIEGAARKLTGKGLSTKEAAKWEQLADLLILELETASSRTEGISSVPAFLTEVLRRQFFASKQNQTSQSRFVSGSKTKPDTVGKSELAASETYEIKPLNDEGREAALMQLQEFATENFLGDFAKWYTPSDWQWLTARLDVSSDSSVPAAFGIQSEEMKSTNTSDSNNPESKKEQTGI